MGFQRPACIKIQTKVAGVIGVAVPMVGLAPGRGTRTALNDMLQAALYIYIYITIYMSGYRLLHETVAKELDAKGHPAFLLNPAYLEGMALSTGIDPPLRNPATQVALQPGAGPWHGVVAGP